MKMWTETITIETAQKREFIDLTPRIKEAVKKSGLMDGLVLVNALHANTGLFVNLDESNFLEDLDAWLEQQAPFREDYKHAKGHESNASAHLKTILMGHQAVLTLEEGRVNLGPWQNVIFAEFDGARPRRIIVKILGE